jgi:Fanconi-associated nuclease 1
MFDLLQRINLVYFRVTEMESNTILLPLILSRSKKRKYPDYTVTRTIQVFKSREHLLAYEAALQLEADIEQALSEGESRVERAEKAYMFFEGIYARWKSLVAEMHANGEEEAYARPGLERFEEGV